MIVVRNEGEVCGLLDVWNERIVGCTEGDVLYMVVSSLLRSALVSRHVVLLCYCVCGGVDVALMGVVMVVFRMCVSWGDL